MIAALALAAFPCSLVAAPQEPEPEPLRVLFLTHSAGFRHGVVNRGGNDRALAETQAEAFAAQGVEVTSTQDCGDVTAENLANFDVLMLYTTGDLPIPEEERAGMLAWLRAGGGLVGIHSATDTWYGFPEYGELIGGYFDGHPWTQEVGVRVEAVHPATAHLGSHFSIDDEIYQYRDFRGEPPLRVLLRLDETSVDIGRGKHDDYPLAWCRDWGEGRAFYTALGHRPEVWRDARFLQHLRGGIRWAAGEVDWSPAPPAGATVLFDGADGGAFANRGAEENRWEVVDGAMQVTPGTGDLVSRETFGSGWWHVEFRTPERKPGQSGQGRGNSGVYVQNRYEVQVLDSYGDAPANNTCGGIYGVAAAAESAASPPEVWQTYDILFTAATFDEAGAKTADARMTVWWNGVRVHDDLAVPRTTTAARLGEGPQDGPLMLQDHGHPVRYRNVWFLPADADRSR